MTKCSVEDCERKKESKLGYCGLHYKRYVRHGKINIEKRNPNQLTICSIEGCEGKYHANGYCSAHNSRLRKYGDPLGKPEERPTKLSGGKRVASRGTGVYETKGKYTTYRWIMSPCHPNADCHGYVLEHRLIMEVHLGRFLDTKESVHHKDGNGLNNSLDNLELLTRTEHAKEHKYWLNSPRIGNSWAKKEYNKGTCKKEGCNKGSGANGFCSNHNRDIWRQKKRDLGLPYS